MKARHGGFV